MTTIAASNTTVRNMLVSNERFCMAIFLLPNMKPSFIELAAECLTASPGIQYQVTLMPVILPLV
jgi:hypothetical protein